ncbi:DUF4242 domain-containing protein [Roseisolibacter sp. H3M3-2]|uniref:DUF4242 domain-containing protein n=1 Tax=Roseisolibacter sp. H3M3-2 TaxID=3031323 RepID=UPI0023DBFC56|nr:DUF4242 domain-containing protein [Roseisolibacter sp. H3M3-2]MDF1505852.1 DUF4242 domain-containing protein [Roseisolibacter sp. H3M3-2]
MPRFMVQRTFPEGLNVPGTAAGAAACLDIVDCNATFGVTWIHSYVTEDRRTSFCVYDGPSADAIARAATASGLPCDECTPVRVLDPYFHVAAGEG